MPRTPTADKSPAPRPGTDLVAALRRRIVGGDLAPGERLTEERLAAEHGVSRIPVRETLRVLATEGFVVSEGYGGTFVSALGEDEAHDLVDVRGVLEPLAAAQAAVRSTSQDVDALRELIEASRVVSRADRYGEISALNYRFHERLALASGNRTIIEVLRVVLQKLEWATTIEAIERGRGSTMTHDDIVDAIADRDPERAAHATAVHIDASADSHGWSRTLDVRFSVPSRVDARAR